MVMHGVSVSGHAVRKALKLYAQYLHRHCQRELHS